MNKIVLEAKKINKYFHDPQTVKVLKELSFSIEAGEFVSIVGKSGCGKSTLLYILSTMDTDYEGELFIDGESMAGKQDPVSYTHLDVYKRQIKYLVTWLLGCLVAWLLGCCIYFPLLIKPFFEFITR